MRATSATVLVIFSKVSFGKFSDHTLKFLLNNYELINNSILKDTLQLKILRI